MKIKIVSILLAISLAASLVGCGSVVEKKDAQAVSEETPEDTEEAEEEEAEEVKEDKEEPEEAEKEEETKEASDEEEAEEEEEVPQAEESIDVSETEYAKESEISGWVLDAQPAHEVDNHTNVAISNVQKQPIGKLPDDAMGAVYLSPTTGSGRDMLFGTRELTLYFQRTGVKPGEGTLSVFRSSDDAAICSVNIAKSARSYTKDDGVFSRLGWENGTRVVVSLPFPLDHNETFYVTADKGCFVADDIESKAIKKGIWEFDVAEYGVIPELPSGSDVYVGGSMEVMVYVHGRADKAMITTLDENRVRLSSTDTEKDRKIDAKFYQLGEDSFVVTFFDRDDNVLGQTTLTYSASMPPEDLKEDKPAKQSNSSSNTVEL